MLRFKHTLIASALAVALTVSGCNLLDGAYSEGGSVENLVDDARFARANGDFERAVELLEEAFAEDPANAVVRLELATTLMQRDGLNSVDLISQVSNFISDATESAEGGFRAPFASRSQVEACSYTSSETDREVFDPTEFGGYGDIIASLPTLERVRELLGGADGSVLPSQLLALSPCEAIVDGEVVYDRAAASQEIYDTFDGDQNLVRTALQLNAVGLILDAYSGIFEQPDLPVDWYLVGSEDNRRLGFCVADEPTLDLLYDRIDGRVADVGQALFSIDLLVFDDGSETLEDLRDEALELYVTFQEDVSRFCD
ncbi:MAG: tetratricopeptide repeat protein [Bacteroidota bacterium]